MEDTLDPGEEYGEEGAGGGRGEILDRSSNPFCGQFLVWSAANRRDVVAEIPEPSADSAADKATSASHNRLHAFTAVSTSGPGTSMAVWDAAQLPRRSRKILALCRASTGNDWWK